MNVLSRIRCDRMAALVLSECETSDLAERALAYVDKLALELLENKDLNIAQRTGIERARHYTPLIFRDMAQMIKSQPYVTDEQKQDFIFGLTMLIDNMLSLGALDGSVKDGMFSRVYGSEGGKKGSATRKENIAKGWHAKAKPVIIEFYRLHDAWSRARVAEETIKKVSGLPSYSTVLKLVGKIDIERKMVKNCEP